MKLELGMEAAIQNMMPHVLSSAADSSPCTPLINLLNLRKARKGNRRKNGDQWTNGRTVKQNYRTAALPEGRKQNGRATNPENRPNYPGGGFAAKQQGIGDR